MKKLGVYLAIFGLGSILLNLIGREFIIMMWIDLWGPEVGWLIRIGMIVAGGAIMILAPAEAAASSSTSSEDAAASDG
ncbi:MAG: hypothetical protein JSS49_26785 [Planctomycetes bacterium]|nr:hypothetical protein [Planctomycetota bacterium]